MSETSKRGRLYICPTPIGNMGDITLRVIEVLKSVDLIACEDTRQSAKLMDRYDIHVPLTSYHDHNRAGKGEKLLDQLISGKNIALISDAGMPGISDPGEDLVKLCIENAIEYTVLPGASAAITALVMSGLPTGRFTFEGFLPRDSAPRKERLAGITDEVRTLILYESPHHLIRTLEDLRKVLGSRKMTIVREISKKFEEKIYTNTQDAPDLMGNKEPKGEYVLIIEGRSEEDIKRERAREYEELGIIEHMKLYTDKGQDKKEAMKSVAKDLGISKRDVYAMLLKEESQDG